MELVSANASSVSLIWHGNADRFMVEYRRADEQWRKHYTSTVAPSVAVVRDLKPSSAYVFRVCAVNDAGQFDEPGPELTVRTTALSTPPADAPGCCTVA
ncbi:unnamed protein product [Pylaiella littoralis]